MVRVKYADAKRVAQAGTKTAQDEIVRNRVAMMTLGKIGFFGDQIIQYAFLRIYANMHDLDVEVPDWDGRLLFGLNDAILSKASTKHFDTKLRLGVDAIVPVISDYLGVDWKSLLGLFIKRQKVPVTEVVVDFIKGDDILSLNKREPYQDLLGWFQFHTRFYSPHKRFFCSLFRPKKELEDSLLEAWKHVSSKGNTVVGVHLRRGDRLNIPLNTNEWIAPIEWYIQWLEGIWHTLDKPVLLLASDSINEVRGYFSKYNPVTASDILTDSSALFTGDGTVPYYYPDFFFLGMCDIVATSNSMFSFTASMLSQRGKLFLRPVLDGRCLVPFDPWNSKPILRRKMYMSFHERYGDYLRVSYLAGGMTEVCKSTLKRIPRFWLQRWLINARTTLTGHNIKICLKS